MKRSIVLKHAFAYVCIFSILLSYGYANVINRQNSTLQKINLDVDIDTKSNQIPGHYLGISLETGELCNTFKRFEDPAFKQLFQNLGPDGVLRIGGRSAENTDWKPNENYTCNLTSNPPTIVTKTMVDTLFSIAKSLHWKVIWTIDLGSNNPQKFADEAQYIVKTYSNDLIGLSIGNEMEIYQDNNIRPKNQPWGYSKYIEQWNAYRQAILNIVPDAPLIGSDSDKNNVGTITRLVQTYYKDLKGVSSHFYVDTIVPNNMYFLERSTINETSSLLHSLRQLADHTNQKVLYITESGSTAAGDDWGRADSFAGSLFLINLLFEGLATGVDTIDLHQSSDASFSPISDNTLAKNPYYALLFTHQAIANGGTLVTVKQDKKQSQQKNVVSYALEGLDGKLRVVILNKDTTDYAVTIAVHGYTSATSVNLESSSLNATKGTTLGNMGVAIGGTWTNASTTTIPLKRSTFDMIMKGISASLVTFTR